MSRCGCSDYPKPARGFMPAGRHPPSHRPTASKVSRPTIDEGLDPSRAFEALAAPRRKTSTPTVPMTLVPFPSEACHDPDRRSRHRRLAGARLQPPGGAPAKPADFPLHALPQELG